MNDVSSTPHHFEPQARRHSVARPLVIAFCGLLAILFVAALIGGRAVQKLRQPIATATESGVGIAMSLRALSAAVDQIEAQLAPRFDVTPRDIQNAGDARTALPELESVRRLVTNLNQYAYPDVALDTLATLHGHFESCATQTLAAQQSLIASQTSVQSMRRELADATSRGAERTRLDSNAASTVNLRSQALLSDLRYEWSVLEATVASVVNAADRADIADASNRFASSLRQLVKGLSRLQSRDSRTEMFQAAGILFDLGRRPDNFFEQSVEHLALRERLATDHEQLVQAASQLRREIQSVAAANDVTTSNILDDAGSRLDQYQTGLVVFLLLSALTGALVLQRYVFDAVVLRLRKLHRTTLQLAGGALDEPIELDGHDEITDLSGALRVFRDHARARATSEAELRRQTAQLEAVNKELDDFAHVASHDLRAPLHGVDALAGFIEEDLGDELPAESAHHLSLIRARIQRLQSLLDALLEFARVGRDNMHTVRVNLGDCIADCATLMARPGFKITQDVTVGDVWLQIAPFSQLVRNLIDNAIKHHDRGYGVVHIKARREDNDICLEIRDDGPGIPVEYHERVFGMFQTLKPRDDVEGSGIGLALLRKTLTHIGGSIDIVSAPPGRRGTNFVVRWPLGAGDDVQSDRSGSLTRDDTGGPRAATRRDTALRPPPHEPVRAAE